MSDVRNLTLDKVIKNGFFFPHIPSSLYILFSEQTHISCNASEHLFMA